MTIFEERSRRWQGRGGPELWDAAWDRVRELLGPILTDSWFSMEHDPDSGVNADGAAGLATALYLYAATFKVHPREVSYGQVRELFPEGGTTHLVARWESLLQELGHDVHHPLDPVSARWLILRTDNSAPDIPGHPHLVEEFDMDVLLRHGPGVIEGLSAFLSPFMCETARQKGLSWWGDSSPVPAAGG